MALLQISDAIEAIPVLTVVQNPDAALLDKVRRRHVLWNRIAELSGIEDGQMIVGEDGAPVVLEDERDRVCGELIDIEREIATIPARTVTGLAAKLALVNDDPLDEDEDDPVKLLVASAWHDAQRLAGQLAQAPVALAPAASVSPDADLLAAWEEWVNTYCEYAGWEGDEKSENKIFDRLTSIEDRMSDLPARTPQGVAVKLRWLFRMNVDSLAASDAITKGTPIDVNELDDNGAMFWKLIGEVEQMAARSGAAVTTPPSSSDARLLKRAEEYRRIYAEKKAVNADINRLAKVLAAECPAPVPLRKAYGKITPFKDPRFTVYVATQDQASKNFSPELTAALKPYDEQVIAAAERIGLTQAEGRLRELEAKCEPYELELRDATIETFAGIAAKLRSIDIWEDFSAVGEDADWVEGWKGAVLRDAERLAGLPISHPENLRIAP